MKKIIKESGLRDIKALAKRYPKAKIYFHQDLDGVTTAIAMKKYLEDNGIDVVDSEVIQYGEKEFAVKKPDASGDVMPVLVDFAHGKPMFVIHTDHHDTQVGAEKDASKSFRQARSNVETISQIISPKELFPSSDILLISTVDSADFAKHDITTKEVVNFLFRLDKEKGLAKNKMLLGLVTNKLLLAFKNKKGFLESLVSYDRYTPFRNNPEADFLIIMWPLGLVQASCNPFKKDRELKGVNLGEIKDEVLNKWKAQLQDRTIPLSTIKYIAESGMGAESVGFTFKDFDAIYGGKIMMMDNGEQILDSLKTIIDKPFSELSEPEMELLDKIGVNAWDLIQANSGGHKCITNISGLNYLGRAKRPPSGPYRYDPEREDAPYIKFVKMIGQEFFKVLKEKIQESKKEG